MQRSHGVPVLEVSGEVFERMSLKEGPQGIAAVMRQRWLPLADARLNAGRVLGESCNLGGAGFGRRPRQPWNDPAHA